MGDAREFDQDDTRLMQRALALALRGAGQVAPNPMVGCVLAKAGAVIAEGWHKGPGKPHAEIEALAAAGEAARGAAAYVTLEPCNHVGRTGPCVDALIEAGVAEVVYAIADPNPVASGGAARLREAGVAMRSGVCEEEARFVNRAWLHSLRHKRPLVIAKTAMSIDGRIATRAGESRWITGSESREKVHELRAGVDAVITGAGTVAADDPALTARCGGDVRHPLRVVLDSTARAAPGAKVFERSGRGAVLATTDRAPATRIAAFREMGVDVLLSPADDQGRPDIPFLLSALHERGIVTAMVEAGSGVLGAFFDADLIDEIAIFVAPMLIGGGKTAFGGKGVAALAEARRFSFQPPEQCGGDILYYGARQRGDL